MCSAEALDWDAGAVPRSRRFDDPYYAGPAGRAETAHVFLAGNGLPGRWAHREGGVFQVAELGFGTGLSFLVTLEAWVRAGAEGRLVFSSVEGFPMAPADRARALAPWPDLAALGAPFLGALPAAPGWHEIRRGAVTLRLGIGEASAMVAGVAPADAWYLDGFSPAKNPAMWTPGLMAAVAARTRPGGTFATYTAAGHVRRALAAAGFAVERVPGFGAKRHMTRGRLDGVAGP